MIKTAALALGAILALLVIGTSTAQDSTPPPGDGERDTRTAPNPPGKLVLQADRDKPGHLEVTFTPGAGSTIHEFRLSRATSQDGTYLTTGTTTLGDSSPTDLGVQSPGYWYRVSAKACDDDDDCSSSVESEVFEHRTPAPANLILSLQDPAGLELTVTFDRFSPNFIYRHRMYIYKSASETGTYELLEEGTIEGGLFATTTEGAAGIVVKTGGWYRVSGETCRIRSTIPKNCSDLSEPSNSVQVPAQPVPKFQPIVRATSQTEVEIGWTGSKGISQYELQVSENSTGPWMDLSIGRTDEEHQHTGLTCGSSRYYQVRGHGEGTEYEAAWGEYLKSPKVTTDSCDVHTFAPAPLALGQASDEWPVPAGTDELQVIVHVPGPDDGDGSALIEIILVRPAGSIPAEYTHGVSNRTKSSLLLTGIQDGSKIRIESDEDDYDEHSNLMTLTFHPGRNSEAGALARGQVQRTARPPRPPFLTIRRQESETDRAANRVRLIWALQNEHDRPETYAFEIRVFNGRSYEEEDAVHRIDLPGTTNPLETTIQNVQQDPESRQATITIRACNTLGECSLGSTWGFTMELPEYSFTPAVLNPGETSSPWNLEFDSDRIFLSVKTTGIPKTGSGHITVRVLDALGTEISTHNADTATDSQTITLTQDADHIRITADPDAFDDTGSRVSIVFHNGDSAAGKRLAQATIQRQRRPSAPVAAGLDVTPLPEREAMISWTAPDGAAPDTEYTVEWAPSPASPSGDWKSLGTATGTGLAIKLYPQLIDHDSFAVRVKAGTGEPSEVVIIVDSPITRVDGDSRGMIYPAINSGQVEIRWKPVPDASKIQGKNPGTGGRVQLRDKNTTMGLHRKQPPQRRYCKPHEHRVTPRRIATEERQGDCDPTRL